jgi:hypothetical protein
MDARRRQYVPISVDIARSRTGRRLLERFGPDGLLVWILVLCAAKKNPNQGEFVYVTEADGWERLGIEPAGFTLDEFFAYTGRLHNTKRVSNEPKTSEIRAWNEWNTSIKRELSAERMRRKRAQKTRNNRRTEVEVEVEVEEIDVTTRAKNAQEARRLHADLTRKLGTT